MNYNEFLEVKEDLLLRIMKIVEDSGAGFAFPSQTLYLGKDEMPGEADAKKISAIIKKMETKGELPIPTFSAQQITELNGTIPFPDK